MKHNVIIEPLSANRAWLGRKWKSQDYKDYDKKLTVLLPRLTLGKPPYCIHITYGFSNRLSDLDNPTKQFLDIAARKYNFNDRDVYKLILEKVIIPRGQEFIEFEITSI